MPQSPPLNAAQPIIDLNDGTMQQLFRDFMNQLNVSIVLEGSGTPEGVVDAFQNSLYKDTAGTTGNILYIKRDTDIACDETKGWILV